jgi:hypothetical protein
MSLGIDFSNKGLTKTIRLATKMSRVFNVSVKKALDDFITADARGSKQIADNLGIKLDLNKANEDMAKKLKIATSELTDQQKSLAIHEQMLERSKDVVQGVSKSLIEHTSQGTLALKKISDGALTVVREASLAFVAFAKAVGTAVGMFSNSMDELIENWKLGMKGTEGFREHDKEFFSSQKQRIGFLKSTQSKLWKELKKGHSDWTEKRIANEIAASNTGLLQSKAFYDFVKTKTSMSEFEAKKAKDNMVKNYKAFKSDVLLIFKKITEEDKKTVTKKKTLTKKELQDKKAAYRKQLLLKKQAVAKLQSLQMQTVFYKNATEAQKLRIEKKMLASKEVLIKGSLAKIKLMQKLAAKELDKETKKEKLKEALTAKQAILQEDLKSEFDFAQSIIALKQWESDNRKRIAKETADEEKRIAKKLLRDKIDNMKKWSGIAINTATNAIQSAVTFGVKNRRAEKKALDKVTGDTVEANEERARIRKEYAKAREVEQNTWLQRLAMNALAAAGSQMIADGTQLVWKGGGQMIATGGIKGAATIGYGLAEIGAGVGLGAIAEVGTPESYNIDTSKAEGSRDRQDTQSALDDQSKVGEVNVYQYPDEKAYLNHLQNSNKKIKQNRRNS